MKTSYTCPECGYLTGYLGRIFEKWLPFMFNHDCEKEKKERTKTKLL